MITNAGFQALEHEKEVVRREKERNRKNKQKFAQDKNKLEFHKRELGKSNILIITKQKSTLYKNDNICEGNV